MRRILMAGAAVLALGGTARADMLVHDPMNYGQLLDQVRTAGQQLQQLQQQYQVLMTTYQAFSHVTDLGSAVGALGLLGVQNPLPVNPYAVQGLINGTGGISSAMGSLGGLVQGNYGANHVYAPTDGSWLSQRLNANGNSIAGAQGIAQQLYQSVAQRMPLIAELQQRISTAQDPKDIMDLQARLATEQSYVQGQQMQAQAVTLWYQAQVDSNRQQQDEKLQKDIDDVLQQATANGAWSGSVAAPAAPGS